MDQQRQYRLRVAGEVRAQLARGGIQIQDLARGTGIPHATLSRRLNGHYPFDTDQLALIAAYFKVPAATFLPDLELASTA